MSDQRKTDLTPTLDVEAPGIPPGSESAQSANHALATSPGFPGAPGQAISTISGSRGHSACGGAPEGAPPTEVLLEGRLEQNHQGVGWTLRDQECPMEGALSFDVTTGAVVWRPTCKSARCPRCSRQVSAQTFALARKALEPIKHTRFMTLTLAPQEWDELRQAMKSWVRRLRLDGYTMELLWVVETANTEFQMKHVHAVQHGDYVPKEVLTESWPYGSTFVEGARQSMDYLAKGVMRYVAKGLDGDGESIEAHMNLNGGRAAHWTRGFFQGMSRDEFRKANPLPGIYFVHTLMGDRRPS